MRKVVVLAGFAALLALPNITLAQSMQADDADVLQAAMKGAYGPLTLKMSELPDDVTAATITLTGSGGIQDLMSYGMSFGGGGSDESVAKLTSYLSVYWMTKKSVVWNGSKYLVAYRADVPLSALQSMGRSGMPKIPDLNLRLQLISASAVVSITPRPDLTKADWMKLAQRSQSVASSGDQSAAVSNLKQVALGAIMYSNDYDDFYPNSHSAAQTFEKIMPYLKNKELAKSLNPNGGVIAFNLNLAAVNLTTLPDPAVTPMFYDSQAWPDGGRPVAFSDGHVKYVPADQWPVVVTELNRKYRQKSAKPVKGGKKK